MMNDQVLDRALLRGKLIAPAAFAVFALVFASATVSAGPMPVGMSTITVSYPTTNGIQTFSGMRDYSGSGPTSATNLGTAPNIAAFNSDGDFGRRVFVSQHQFPMFTQVIRPNETPITHAFFKQLGNETGDFFPGITENASITVRVDNVQFNAPVTLDENTLLFHTLWNDQLDTLRPISHHIHNDRTATASFRDLQDFQSADEFADLPHPNHVLADPEIDWSILGNGTNNLSILVTFPYTVLAHLDEMHQHHGARVVPEGLPAPHGFLEPFHFHIEYTVTPEPGTLALLACASAVLFRGRRR